MDRCASCGATLPPGAGWCGQCFAARSPAPLVSPGMAVSAAVPAPFRPGAVAPSEAPVPFRPGAATPSVAPEALVRHTRWGKTATTFGPTGRVVATLLLLIPLVVMGVGGLADPFVWGGAGLYLAVVVPWALRDIWKAGIVRVG